MIFTICVALVLATMNASDASGLEIVLQVQLVPVSFVYSWLTVTVLVYASCVVIEVLGRTPLGPVHVNTTATPASTYCDSWAVQVRVWLWFTIRLSSIHSWLILGDGGATSKKELSVTTPIVETQQCIRSTSSLCTMMFLVELRADDVAFTSDWQVYRPPWEKRRGWNVRVKFVTLPDLTGGLTVISLLFVITVLLGYIHWTTGGIFTSTVQVRLNVFPATVVPDPKMITMCESSGGEHWQS